MTRAILVIGNAFGFWGVATVAAYVLGWTLAEVALVVACGALAVAVLR